MFGVLRYDFPVATRALVTCEWCLALMVKTEADVLCVACGFSFADQLFPPSTRLWGEEISLVRFNGGFEDSKYGSELAEDDRRFFGSKALIDGSTGGVDKYDDSQPHCSMYEKMASVWHLEKEAIPLSDDAWAMQCHQNVPLVSTIFDGVCHFGSNFRCLAFCAMIVPVAIREFVTCEWCSYQGVRRNHGGTGGVDKYDDFQPHCSMYEKMVSTWTHRCQ